MQNVLQFGVGKHSHNEHDTPKLKLGWISALLVIRENWDSPKIQNAVELRATLDILFTVFRFGFELSLFFTVL